MTERKFSLGFVKDFIYLLLLGIDYLHTECRVVHTGRVISNPFMHYVQCSIELDGDRCLTVCVYQT